MQGKNPNDNYQTFLVRLHAIAIIAQAIFKEIWNVWVTFQKMKYVLQVLAVYRSFYSNVLAVKILIQMLL